MSESYIQPESNSSESVDRSKKFEEVMIRIDKVFEVLKKGENDREIASLRNSLIKSFTKLISTLKAQSVSENESIFEIIEKMEGYASNLGFNLSGDSYLDSIYSPLAQMIFLEEMSKEQVEKLIHDRSDKAFIHGILKAGGDKILEIDQMSNDEIIHFGDTYLRDVWVENSGKIDNYETWKTHNAMMIWDGLFKHLHLEHLSDEDIIRFGEKHNDGELWRYIFECRQDRWMSLDQQKRDEIADRITLCYAQVIGKEPKKVIDFGGPIHKPLSRLKNIN